MARRSARGELLGRQGAPLSSWLVMSYRLKTSGDWWPLMVIATLSATPARRMLRIALRRRSWMETPAKERHPVGPRRFTSAMPTVVHAIRQCSRSASFTRCPFLW